MSAKRPRMLRDTIATHPSDATPVADSFGGESTQANDETAGLERRGVLVRVSPEIWRALRFAAITRDTTVQNLMLEAIEIVLDRREETPVP